MTNDNEESAETSEDIAESLLSEETSERNDNDVKSIEASSSKKPKKLSLSTFICSAAALVLAAVMLTYTVCNSFYKKELADAQLNGAQNIR